MGGLLRDQNPVLGGCLDVLQILIYSIALCEESEYAPSTAGVW